MSEPEGRGAAWTDERGTSEEGRPGLGGVLEVSVGGSGEPEGRGAAWTDERGTSEEGRPGLDGVLEVSVGGSGGLLAVRGAGEAGVDVRMGCR